MLLAPTHLAARVTFSASPLRKSYSSNNKGGLLLPNIPVNKDHRTLLDTLAELACAGSSSSDVLGSGAVAPQHSPHRRARAMSEPWFVDDSYRYADTSDATSSSGVSSLAYAAMMDGGYDGDMMDPACVLTSLAASRSPLTSAYGSSSSSNSTLGSGSSGTGTSLFGIASWATRKLPEYVPRSSQAANFASSQSLPLPQLLEDGMDYSSIYNQNGRIGIYTRDERQCIIARFHEKKRRRVWKKKIRYHCRKNLADRRVRVKGRFVRASSMDADADAGGGDGGGAGTGAGGSNEAGASVEDGARMDDDEEEEDVEEDVAVGQSDEGGVNVSGSGNGSGSGGGNVGGGGSPGFVGKRSRLTGAPTGSAAEGMRAFWQNVASAGDTVQQPRQVPNHHEFATTSMTAITTFTTVAEEEDDDGSAGDEEGAEGFGTANQPKATGKRIRRYTIAY